MTAKRPLVIAKVFVADVRDFADDLAARIETVRETAEAAKAYADTMRAKGRTIAVHRRQTKADGVVIPIYVVVVRGEA